MDFLFTFVIELVTLGLSILALRVPLCGVFAILFSLGGLLTPAADYSEPLNQIFCIGIIFASFCFTIVGVLSDR